ncbi:hypothetical protein DAPPUDRAFT_319280 [Daphnia pulex]|uniref:G-protein coupled receptors family 1 profile domain-containing protein n=1 Tax=Daphnia pulex TaxID=6669 RepID=E9GL85_DAPPU|nr:hypothetical protein DAPPUDRAFT_319280 [Daphnia pulex]|eukprot:EFX79837.1 hypothetical protein DAPPUDRAFT_319280 [Daphnia pulex]
MNSTGDIFTGNNNQVIENGSVENSDRNNESNSTLAETANNIHNPLNGSFPIEMDLFRSTCHLLLVSTGVPLNLFIAVIIMAYKRLHNKPRNVLWLGVTCFNLLTLLTILIEFVAYHTQNNVVCLVFVSVTGVAYTSILFNLLLALIDRYAAIVHPIWHRQNVTVRWVVIGQSIGFVLIVVVIKFPFIAQLAPPYCGYYPVHAKLIAVTNFSLFLSCIVAQMTVYFKTRQYFNSSRRDGSEATVTFVLSAMQRQQQQRAIAANNSCSTPSNNSQPSRLPSAEAVVNINSPSANSAGDRNLIDSSSAVIVGSGNGGQQMVRLRRHQSIGGNRQMEVEATWSLLSGVFSLLLFTSPTLVLGFVEWGCRMSYGEGRCPPVIGIIMFYARELLLGHLVYNPVMYMIRNREFSSTVREKIRFTLRSR